MDAKRTAKASGVGPCGSVHMQRDVSQLLHRTTPRGFLLESIVVLGVIGSAGIVYVGSFATVGGGDVRTTHVYAYGSPSALAEVAVLLYVGCIRWLIDYVVVGRVIDSFLPVFSS